LHENVIRDTTPYSCEKIMHVEHTLEAVHEEMDGEAPRRSKRQRIAKYFGDDFSIYLI
jgi:hypothetical protein